MMVRTTVCDGLAPSPLGWVNRVFRADRAFTLLLDQNPQLKAAPTRDEPVATWPMRGPTLDGRGGCAATNKKPMRFKDVIYRWLKLAVATTLLGVLHYALNLAGAPKIAHTVAPAYAQLSEEKALDLAKAALATRSARFLNAQAQRKDDPCWFEDVVLWRQSMDCTIRGTKMPALLEPKLDIGYEHSQHREQYESSVLEPTTERIRIGLTVVFGVFYGVFALLALLSVFKWFTTTGRPAAVKALVGFSKVLRTPQFFKNFTDARRLRKAEVQIQTLENLQESGLITADEFSKRKKALRETLQA